MFDSYYRLWDFPESPHVKKDWEDSIEQIW